jgi:hypothetical protein
MRANESPESVSMRDVKRCTKLERFFKQNHIQRESSKLRPKATPFKRRRPPTKKQRMKQKSINFKKPAKLLDSQPVSEELDEVELLLAELNMVPESLTSIILALAICYHTRLGTTQMRSTYRCIFLVFFFFFFFLCAKIYIDSTKCSCKKSSNFIENRFQKNNSPQLYSGSKKDTSDQCKSQKEQL